MEYRMYCLAERHLSPMQKAIQSAHAIVEYIGNSTPMDDTAKALSQWMDKDKTIIILDGGTSDDMTAALTTLKDNDIHFAEFLEPDMGGFCTAICFLADERVYDNETFGWNYDDYAMRVCDNGYIPNGESKWIELIGGTKNSILKMVLQGKRLAI